MSFFSNIGSISKQIANMLTEPTLQGFIQSLQSLETFDPTKYAQKIQQASRYTPAMTQFQQYFPQPDPSQQNASFDGQDCTGVISELAAVTSARAMALINDEFNFHGIVDSNKALDMAKSNVTKLIPYLYGDHVNSHLAAAGIVNLQQLRTNSVFVKQYQDELLSMPFDRLAEMHDDAAKNRDYTTNLIFVNEYFKHGPGYGMSTGIPSGVQNQDPTHWAVIVSNWVKTCISPDFVSKYPRVQASVLVPHMSVVYAIGGHPDSDPRQLASNLKQSSNDLAAWDIAEDVQYYASLSQTIWSNWDGVTSNYQDAVQQAENSSTKRSWAGGREMEQMYILTTYADGAAAFVSQCQSLGIFHGQPGNREKFHQEGGFGGGCFAPGTMILRDSNDKVKIEDLREGTAILTQGGPKPQYGICSDEDVVHPVSSKHYAKLSLWGFNEAKPFFTAGHVFHTTTGPRAIDPVIAKKENPWFEVGRLEVGHSLLHTYDGSSYDIVPITSLHAEPADCEYVYGVHLRSGLRSYHANGYLVHLNYPEITIKSLAKLLVPLSHKKRLGLLRSFSELKPLFQRFGALTLLEALDDQLSGVDGLPKNLLGKKTHPVMKPGAEHIHRAWRLKDDRPWSANIGLPTIQARQGILYIDGNYVKHAKVSGSRIIWSRSITNNNWEHGYLNLRDDLLVGIGALIYAPEGVKPDTSNREELRHFSAVAGNLAQSLTRPAAPFAMLSSASVRDVSSELDAPPAAPANITPAPSYPILDYYQLSYDTGPWAQGQVIPTNPTPYFLIYDTMLGSLHNYSCRIPVLDKIRDKLCEHTQKDNSVQLTTIPELYDCWNSLDAHGNNVLYFQIRGAEILAQAADGFVEDQSKSYMNLTFKNLGLDVTVPFVFEQMRLTMSWDGQGATGIIRVHDPTMEGSIGKRILVTGTYVNPSPEITMANQRQKIASATVGTSPGSPIEETMSAHLAPPESLVRMAADSQAVPTDNQTGAQELVTALSLEPQTVHDVTQKLLYRTMLYHMNDGDRNTFTSATKPTEGIASDQVPTALASQLESEIVTWIQNKYIPMWIAKRVISMGDDVQKTWRQTFSNQQKKKIDYFWQGKGTTCLSQAPEYNLLNQSCATYGLRLASPRLAQYADDPVPDPSPGPTKGMSGGMRWATVLYNSQADGPAFNQLCLGYNSASDTTYNQAQKLCNIFQVLNPIPQKVPDGGWTAANKPFSMKLMDKIKVNAQTYGIVFQAVPISNDQDVELEYQWLYNSMQSLWLALLRGDKGYGDQVGTQMQNDANNLVTALGIKADQTAEMKAEQIALLTARIIRNSVLFTRVASNLGITAKLMNGVKGIQRCIFGVEKAIAAENDPKLSTAGGYMHLAMSIGTMAMFIGSAWSAYRDFSSLKEADRGKLILATVQTALVMVSQLRDAYKVFKGVKAYQKGIAAAAVEQNDRGGVEEERKQSFPDEDSRNASDMAYGADNPGGASDSALAVDRGTASSLKKSTQEIEMQPPLEEDPPEIPIGDERPPALAENPSIATKLKENFDLGEHGVRVALLLVGSVMTILACIGIAAAWSQLDIVSKWLDIVGVIQQGLSLIVEGTQLVLDVADITTGVAETVCAWAGPILAIIGLAIMVAQLIWGALQPPPLTPIEVWIRDTGHPGVDLLVDPPNPKLSWTSTTLLPAGQANSVCTIQGTNTSTNDAILYSITTNILSGSATDALFTDTAFVAEPAGQSTLQTGQVAYTVLPQATSITNIIFTVATGPSQTGADGTTQTQFNIGVTASALATPQLLTTPPGASVEIKIMGTVGPAGNFTVTVTETGVDANNLPWDDVDIDLVIVKQ